MNDSKEKKPLTEQEQKVVDLMRTMKYGELKIKFRDGKPVLAEKQLTEKLD
ncbi:MAG: hypothetical protein ACYDG4_10640 [Desulfuromonadaceae bacterium]